MCLCVIMVSARGRLGEMGGGRGQISRAGCGGAVQLNILQQHAPPLENS